MAASILGVVIGKAIFERIPLNCYLNYTILRQLGGRPLQFNDLYSYDKDVCSNVYSFTTVGTIFSTIRVVQVQSCKIFVFMSSTNRAIKV